MELLVAIAVGVMFFSGFYLILQASLVRSILGIAFLSNAANLVLFSFSTLTKGGSVFIGRGEGTEVAYSDPLTQALILTAIVIGLAFLLFFLVLALVSHPILGGDSIVEGKYELDSP